MKHYFYYETPIGWITLEENGEGITSLDFGKHEPKDGELRETPLLAKGATQLKEYFEGKRKTFELNLLPQGTPFQLKVWQALQEIPYGKTCSYKEIAQRVGSEKGFRAVGMANNRNPIPIFIPCHRVIGSNGGLVGYGGGLDIKVQLLELEKRHG